MYVRVRYCIEFWDKFDFLFWFVLKGEVSIGILLVG